MGVRLGRVFDKKIKALRKSFRFDYLLSSATKSLKFIMICTMPTHRYFSPIPFTPATLWSFFDVWGVIFDQLLNSLVQKSALSGFKGLKMNLIVLNLFFERHRVPLMDAPPLRNVSMRKLHH